MNEFKFKSKDELSNFLKSKSGKILEFNENNVFIFKGVLKSFIEIDACNTIIEQGEINIFNNGLISLFTLHNNFLGIQINLEKNDFRTNLKILKEIPYNNLKVFFSE